MLNEAEQEAALNTPEKRIERLCLALATAEQRYQSLKQERNEIFSKLEGVEKASAFNHEKWMTRSKELSAIRDLLEGNKPHQEYAETVAYRLTSELQQRAFSLERRLDKLSEELSYQKDTRSMFENRAYEAERRLSSYTTLLAELEADHTDSDTFDAGVKYAVHMLRMGVDQASIVESRKSRLDFAADAMAVVERRRDELKAERDGYASGFDALREVVNVNAYMQDTPLWKEVAAIVRGSAVEKHERNCCEWHKAGGDLEYPCNRL